MIKVLPLDELLTKERGWLAADVSDSANELRTLQPVRTSTASFGFGFNATESLVLLPGT